MRTFLAVTALLVWPGFMPAPAAEDVPPALAERLAVMVSDQQPDHVVESALPGIYEVRYGPFVVYFSADGRHMLRGDLLDLETGDNMTEVARSHARAEAVGALGDASMVVFAPSTAKHTITVFTDIDCGYCQLMHQQIADYNRLGIEIRYTAFPRAGIGSDTYDRMVSVWCASDQQAAMTDAKAGRAVETAQCDNPVGVHYDAGQAIGVRGTPSIVLESGEMIPGYVEPQELLDRLEGRASG
ncbi:MAG: DsbC family protein [Thiotrichales bacterium]|nr:DsbC family protein [Thiotrichales bacterium]MCY4285697.1 DsbC family protein [Thiotrichales bacterium]